jgi:hypothetical protein
MWTPVKGLTNLIAGQQWSASPLVGNVTPRATTYQGGGFTQASSSKTHTGTWNTSSGTAQYSGSDPVQRFYDDAGAKTITDRELWKKNQKSYRYIPRGSGGRLDEGGSCILYLRCKC